MAIGILKRAALVIALFGSSATSVAQDDGPKTFYTLIKNVNIFDGVNDGLKPGSVLIENNLIKAVGVIRNVPAGTTIIDGGGRTLMPGIIEGHGHIGMPPVAGR